MANVGVVCAGLWKLSAKGARTGPAMAVNGVVLLVFLMDALVRLTQFLNGFCVVNNLKLLHIAKITEPEPRGKMAFILGGLSDVVPSRSAAKPKQAAAIWFKRNLFRSAKRTIWL